jgi:hypothetical protein
VVGAGGVAVPIVASQPVDGGATRLEGISRSPPVRRSRTSTDERREGATPTGSRRSISPRPATAVAVRAFARRRYVAADFPDRPDDFTPAAASAQSMHQVMPLASTLQSRQIGSSHRRHTVSA